MQDSASESIKKSDVGNLLIKLEKLYKQCKDAVQPKSEAASTETDGAVVEAASISETV